MGPVGDFLDKNDGLGPGGLGYPFRNNPFHKGDPKGIQTTSSTANTLEN